MTTALRSLLANAVDYAGLYPPAALEVPAAVKNYRAYRGSEDRWMLGRFVVGVGKLPELRATVRAFKPAEVTWPVTVVAPDAAAATAVLRGYDDAHARIESVEVRAQSPADIALIGRAADKTREVYVEIPLDASMDAMLDALVAARLRAKIRTGGVTSAAFPSAESVVKFIRGCIDRDIPFKATAGLHHPLRGTYQLGDARSATGEMFGFLNVFLASALMRVGLSDAGARELMVESDPASIAVEEKTLMWRDHAIEIDEIKAARTELITSFGSCSFREPVDELPFPLTTG